MTTTFFPPPPPPMPARFESPVQAVPYKSTRRLARWLAFGFGALVVANVAVAAAHARAIAVVNEVGHGLRPDEVASVNASLQSTSIALIVFGLATGIPFLCWFYRVHKNLRAMRINPGRKDWVAVGAFIAPIVNIWSPWQIGSEIWRASDPGADLTTWRHSDVSWFVHLWGLGSALAIAGAGITRVIGDDSVASWRTLHIVLLVVSICAAGSAAAAARFVRELTARQDVKSVQAAMFR